MTESGAVFLGIFQMNTKIRNIMTWNIMQNGSGMHGMQNVKYCTDFASKSCAQRIDRTFGIFQSLIYIGHLLYLSFLDLPRTESGAGKSESGLDCVNLNPIWKAELLIIPIPALCHTRISAQINKWIFNWNLIENINRMNGIWVEYNWNESNVCSLKRLLRAESSGPCCCTPCTV